MKKVFKITVFTALAMILCLLSVSCSNEVNVSDLWKNATYTEDTEFGNGEKTVLAEVKAGERSVTFTINTDKETVGEALAEHDLISGEQGPYGLYVKVVNGITADYEINQSYWGFWKNGESMQTGVDGAVIEDGEHYELVYTN